MTEAIIIILIVVIITEIVLEIFERQKLLKGFNEEKKQMLENFQTQIRETVLALKTDKPTEYIDSIPDIKESEALKEDETDEFVELNDVEPHQLIKAIKNNQNEN